MQTLQLTLSATGNFIRSTPYKPKGYHPNGNVVYDVINIPDELTQDDVRVLANQMSPNKIKDYTIDFANVKAKPSYHKKLEKLKEMMKK
jgi:hypothetical protein